MSEGATVDVTARDDVCGKPVGKAEVTNGHEGGRTTSTGDDGKATLKPVHPGWVVVEATAAGYAPGTSFATLGSTGAHGQVTILLRKGIAVSGRVIDDHGKPLAKVHVVVGNDLGGGFGRRARGPATTSGGSGKGDDEEGVTDDKGQFAFAAVAPGSHAARRATASRSRRSARRSR